MNKDSIIEILNKKEKVISTILVKNGKTKNLSKNAKALLNSVDIRISAGSTIGNVLKIQVGKTTATTVIQSGSVVGDNVTIKSGAKIGRNVSIGAGLTVGDRAIITKGSSLPSLLDLMS